MAQQAELMLKKAQISAVEGQANESNARAKKYSVETTLYPKEVEIKQLSAAPVENVDLDEKEFKRRLQIVEAKLKERDLNIKEKSIMLQTASKMALSEREQRAKDRLQRKGY